MVPKSSPTGACRRQLVGRRRRSLIASRVNTISNRLSYFDPGRLPGHFFISSGPNPSESTLPTLPGQIQIHQQEDPPPPSLLLPHAGHQPFKHQRLLRHRRTPPHHRLLDHRLHLPPPALGRRPMDRRPLYPRQTASPSKPSSTSSSSWPSSNSSTSSTFT